MSWTLLPAALTQWASSSANLRAFFLSPSIRNQLAIDPFDRDKTVMYGQQTVAAEIIVFATAPPLPPTPPLLLPAAHHHRGPKRSRLIEQPSGEWPGAWKWCLSTVGSLPKAPPFRKQWSEQVALKCLDVAQKHAIAHRPVHSLHTLVGNPEVHL